MLLHPEIDFVMCKEHFHEIENKYALDRYVRMQAWQTNYTLHNVAVCVIIFNQYIDMGVPCTDFWKQPTPVL